MTMNDLTPTGMADRVVLTMAKSVTRRRFLRNTGATALGVALGTAYFGKTNSAWAGAFDCYGSHGPCGPSPICPTGICGGGECFNYHRRPHDGFTCGTATVANCWAEYCECGAT